MRSSHPRPGGSRESIAPGGVPARAQAGPRRADEQRMRALLEFLGIVTPDQGRREPVALPAWAPRVLQWAVLGFYGLVFTLAYALVRALLF